MMSMWCGSFGASLLAERSLAPDVDVLVVGGAFVVAVGPVEENAEVLVERVGGVRGVLEG